MIAPTFDYAAAAKEQVPTCNLCGCHEFKVLTWMDRVGLEARHCLCTRCSLVRIHPRMTQEAYDDFYSSGEYRRVVSKFSDQEVNAETIQDSQRAYGQFLLQHLGQYVQAQRGGTMLDVGGSTGIVGKVFGDSLGMKVVVVDPSHDETEVARKLGMEAHAASIETWNDPRQFELVMVIKTIDHLLDPMATLRRCREFCKGLMIIDAINFPLLYHHAGQKVCKIDHPHGFNDIVMQTYLVRTGFKVLKAHGSPDQRSLIYVCEPTEPKPDARIKPGSSHHIVMNLNPC